MKQGLGRDLLLGTLGFVFGSLLVVAHVGGRGDESGARTGAAHSI